MIRTFAEKRAAFRALHQQGCFVLPNPWDSGSARMLQHLGFFALAAMLSVAKQMKAGSFEGLSSGIPGQELNEIFGSFS